MEQHPVPQNVTTFQFRLIGDMTIKQFGHLAAGAILAYISYKLPLPFFFSWPLTIIFALGGVGFAFVPIEERPMDVWVLSFLKNVYSPTVYVWEKSSSPQTPVVQTRVSQAITAQTARNSLARPPSQEGAPVAHQNVPQQKSAAGIITSVYATWPQPTQTLHSQRTRRGAFDWFSSLFSTKQQSQAPLASPSVAPHMTTPSVVGSRLDMSIPPTVSRPTQQMNTGDPEKKEAKLEEKLTSLKHELEDSSISQARILELQKQLTEVLMQKDKMALEVQQLQRQLRGAQGAVQGSPKAPPNANAVQPTPQRPLAQPQQKQPTVKIITPESAVRVGLPRLTTFPNVVTGITKDSDNNLLPGVLVTVKDKDGIPVRALKTNRLGQFAASTPLPNGVYFVEIEDPRGRYTFDRVQITLNGSIVPALEIITKSQKQITRDRLTKELFGNTT